MKQLLSSRESKRNLIRALIILIALISGIQLATSSGRAMNIYQPPLESFDQNVNYIQGTKTEKELTQLMKNRHFIGTVTLVKNNHLVYQQGFGYANQTQGLMNSGKVTYQIASIQKSMTAVLLMKTAAEKHFSLDTPVSKFYPQIQGANLITLRNLLTMTSGIADQRPIKKPANDRQFLQYTVNKVKINPQMIGQLHYQPVNFVLLAGIIQREKQMSYYKYFEQNIIKPLGLRYSYFYQNMNKYRAVQAQGYHFNPQKPTAYVPFKEKRAGYDEQLGTGNLYMSNGDLYQTLRAFMTSSILTPRQTAALYSPGKTRSTYLSGVYSIRQTVPQLLGQQYSGYHFHGTEFGFDTIGDISKNGADAVIFTSNAANYGANNNYSLDIPIYKQLIDDSQIF